jgi:hypothetical protein
MPELFPIPLAEQIKCVERELGFRRRVYPRRVAALNMTQAKADEEIGRMTAVLDTLIWVRDNGR